MIENYPIITHPLDTLARFDRAARVSFGRRQEHREIVRRAAEAKDALAGLDEQVRELETEIASLLPRVAEEISHRGTIAWENGEPRMTAALRNHQSYLLGPYSVQATRQEDGRMFLVSQPRKSFVWRIDSDDKLSIRNGEGYWQPETRFTAKDLHEILGSIEVGY